jgi:hypothetical protein
MWPDGIDSVGDPWFRDHEGEWTAERVERVLSMRVNTDADVNVLTAGKAVGVNTSTSAKPEGEGKDRLRQRRDAAREGMRKLRALRLVGRANPKGGK